MDKDLATELVPVVYSVPGTTPPLLVGVNSRGSVLLGEPKLSGSEPVTWQHQLNGPDIAALQQVLETARVDARGITLDRLAREHVTDEMVAAATAAFEASDEDTDRGRMIDALGAAGLMGPFTADDALGAFRQAQPGTGIRAALLAVARSRIADGTI